MSTISIPFKGSYYMCVKGSKRDYALKAANYAFDQGDHDLANALCAEALKLPGCAFEAREQNDHEPRENNEAAWIAACEDIREQ